MAHRASWLHSMLSDKFLPPGDFTRKEGEGSPEKDQKAKDHRRRSDEEDSIMRAMGISPRDRPSIVGLE